MKDKCQRARDIIMKETGCDRTVASRLLARIRDIMKWKEGG